MDNTTYDKAKKKHISKNLFIYILLLAITAAVLMVYLFKTYYIGDYTLLVVFSILSIIAETFLIPLPKIGAVSVSFALTYSAILLTNPLTAVLITSIGVAFRFPFVDGRGRVHLFNNPIYKTIFNVSQYIVNSGIAGIVYIQSLQFQN